MCSAQPGQLSLSLAISSCDSPSSGCQRRGTGAFLKTHQCIPAGVLELLGCLCLCGCAFTATLVSFADGAVSRSCQGKHGMCLGWGSGQAVPGF